MIRILYFFITLEIKFIKEGNNKTYLKGPSGNWSNSFWNVSSSCQISYIFFLSQGLYWEVIQTSSKKWPFIHRKRPDLLPLLLLTKNMNFKHLIQVVNGVATISWCLIEYFQLMPIFDVVCCKLALKRDVLKENVLVDIHIDAFWVSFCVRFSTTEKPFAKSGLMNFDFLLLQNFWHRQWLNLRTPWILPLKKQYS